MLSPRKAVLLIFLHVCLAFHLKKLEKKMAFIICKVSVTL